MILGASTLGVFVAGTEIANAYISLQTKMPGVQGDIASALGGVDTSGAANKVGTGFNSALAGAVGGAVATIATKAIDTIGQSIGSAISRVDTMNNFPKITENLGYSADEAEDSIAAMSEGLQGLPTTLDGMVSAVQQLAPLTGGLEEATELSLALNNALLAGGKSTDLQANAMEQYTQMLAVGKVDMAAWKSLISTMPGQMSQLSEELLGTGKSAFDLYDALQAGTLGFDDLNGAILTLNSEGTGEFASFADQATSATDGIGTGMAQFQTAVTRGLANVIQKLKPVIDAVVVGATDIVNALGPALVTIVETGFAIVAWGKANSTWLAPLGVAVGVIVGAFVAWNVATKAWLAMQAIVKGVQTAYIAYTYGMTAATYGYQGASKIATAAQWLFNAALSANPIAIIVIAIAALVAGLIYFFTQTELGQEIWANFTQFMSEAWENTVTFITEAFENVGTFITEALANIASGWESVWVGIGNFLKDTWNNILGWIEGGVNGAIDLINGMMGGIRDVAGFIGIEVGTIPHVGIPRLAEGGVVSKSRGGTLAVVGEGRYDEAVIPLSPAVLAQMSGGGGGPRVQVDVHGQPGMDEFTVGTVAARKIGEELRMAG